MSLVVRHDVELKGGILRAGTVVEEFGQSGEFVGISWADEKGHHSMALERRHLVHAPPANITFAGLIGYAMGEVDGGHPDAPVTVTAADLVMVRAMGAALDAIVGDLSFHQDGTQGPSKTVRSIRETLDRLYAEHPGAAHA